MVVHPPRRAQTAGRYECAVSKPRPRVRRLMTQCRFLHRSKQTRTAPTTAGYELLPCPRSILQHSSPASDSAVAASHPQVSYHIRTVSISISGRHFNVICNLVRKLWLLLYSINNQVVRWFVTSDTFMTCTAETKLCGKNWLEILLVHLSLSSSDCYPKQFQRRQKMKE